MKNKQNENLLRCVTSGFTQQYYLKATDICCVHSDIYTHAMIPIQHTYDKNTTLSNGIVVIRM